LRLSEREVSIIKNRVQSIFGKAVVYLFGSRVDDSKVGGDIDLYVVSNKKENLFQKKLKLQITLEDLLYKPVDVILATNPNRLIEQEALKGIKI